MDKNKLVKLLKSTLISIAFGTVTMLLMIVVFSFVMTKIGFSNTVATIVAILVSITGGFVAGYTNALLLKEKGILAGLCCGIILAFLMIILKLAFFSEPFSYISVIKFAFLIVSAASGGIIGVNKKYKNKYAKIKSARV